MTRDKEPTNAEPMRVGLYLRVSTEHQSQNGTSLASQENFLRSYAAAKSWRIVKVFRENGFSAKNTQRPALQQLLADVKAGEVDVVAIYKLDRLTRSVGDLCGLVALLKRYHVELVSLTESLDTTTPSGMLLVNILGSIAEWERQTIAARTKAALQRKRENGEVYGPTPFGFRRRGNRLLPDAKTMQTVADIFRLRKEGRTLQAICDDLMERKVKAPRGGTTWGPESVRIVLNNPLYRGGKPQ
jgi:site-specific DNA recombinase